MTTSNRFTAHPVGCLIGASFLYGIIPSFVKLATQVSGIPAYLFLSNAVAFLLGNLVLAVRRVSPKVEGVVLKDVLLFGCLSTLGTSSLLTLSYQYISIGVATTIHFAYPVLVMTGMAAVFREKLSMAKIAAILCALAGVVLIAGPGGGFAGKGPLLGILFALASSVTYGVFVIANDKSAFAKLDPFVLFFYLSGVSAAVFGAFALFTNSLSLVPSPVPYLMALCQQGCNMGAVVLFAFGVRVTGASTGAAINMLEPAVSLLSGILIFHDLLTPSALAGCGLILLSLLSVSRKGKDAPSDR